MCKRRSWWLVVVIDQELVVGIGWEVSVATFFGPGGVEFGGLSGIYSVLSDGVSITSFAHSRYIYSAGVDGLGLHRVHWANTHLIGTCYFA